MNLVELTGLFGIMAVMAAVPSTSVVIVVSRSATSGFSSGVAAAAGIATGDLLFVALAMASAAAASMMLGEYFTIAKYLGGLYLIWFGISLLRGSSSPQGVVEKESSLLGSYFAGLLFTLSDLKAVFFYASLFPAFVDIERLTPTGGMAIALGTAVIVGTVKVGYAYVANWVATRAAINGRNDLARKLAGTVSVGAGVLVVTRA